MSNGLRDALLKLTGALVARAEDGEPHLFLTVPLRDLEELLAAHPARPDAGTVSAGLHNKYYVSHLNDPAGKHDHCWYFVLDPAHDPAAVAALQTYATETLLVGNGDLAADLRTKVREFATPLTARATDRESIVAGFIEQREEYVRVLRQCVDADADYHRWQGHAEARRQLAEKLSNAAPVGGDGS